MIKHLVNTVCKLSYPHGVTLFCDVNVLLMFSPNVFGLITEVVKYMANY